MLSEKLKKFVGLHRPVGRQLSVEEIGALAQEAGLAFEDYGPKRLERYKIRQGQASSDFGVEGLRVVWWNCFEGGFVVYRPWIRGFSMSPEPAEALLACLGYTGEEKVSLPEAVVTLPVPGWVALGGMDPFNAELLTTQCFASEVSACVEPFMKELQALMR